MIDNYFLYCLWDKDKNSYYVDANGGVSKTSQFQPLKNKPINWQDIQPSFDTQTKYFSLVKSLNVPLQYVLDGAEIIRFLLYKGKGYQEEIYSVIFEWNPNTGIHELSYGGQLDLSKPQDDPQIGITVNTKEGGLQAILDANDGVTYEIPLTDNPVMFDGVLLHDKLNYTVYEIDTIEGAFYPVGIVYVNNEGDSVGIFHNSQDLEILTSTEASTYAADSNNYLFKSVKPITIHLQGQLHFKNIGGLPRQYFVNIEMPTRGIPLLAQVVNHNEEVTITLNHTIALAANEPLFITVGGFAINTQWFETKLTIEYDSINDISYAYSITLFEAFAYLVDKMSNGKYTFQSSFLSTHKNLVLTSGQALRELANPVLKLSFEDLFNIADTQYCLCVNIVKDVLYVEKRDVFYSSKGSTIFSIGQISDLKINVDDEKIINTIKVGWPDQQYDERNGKYEYNTTNEFKAPVTIKKGELNLIGKARGDCYGMEFIRGKLNNRDTTDNKGDNEAFMVNTTSTVFNASYQVNNNSAGYSFTFTDASLLNYFVSKGKIKLTGTVSNNSTFTIDFVTTYVGGFFSVFVIEPTVTETVTNGLITLDLLTLKRVVYNSLTGMPTPNTAGRGAAFNIEEMTPKRRLLNWGSYLRSVLFQLGASDITFQTSLKNKDLVTVLNGVTISENANVRVASLAAPFFLNYKAAFKCEVPLTFYKTLTNLQAASGIVAKYNGFNLNFLPIGKMSQKSATHDAQEWELLLSANNNLDTLYKLSQEGLYISDGMNNTLRSSIYNPVQWVFYNKTLPTGVKYKDMFDDWVHHRNDQFAVQPAYLQKWEKSDHIRNQFITNGLAQLELYIYDSDARLVTFFTSTLVVNATVQAPYTLQQFDIDISGFAEGNYLFAIKSGGTVLLVSEWQNIADVQYNTYKNDYSNSYNKLDAYFNTFKPTIRYEAMWGRPNPDGSLTTYEDEPKNLKLLHSEEYVYKTLYIGYGGGIPDWLLIKLNSYLSTDRLFIEGTHTVRPTESKIEVNDYNGYPFASFKIDLRNASGDLGITVDASGTPQITSGSSIYTIDAEAYGNAGQVIQVELNP